MFYKTFMPKFSGEAKRADRKRYQNFDIGKRLAPIYQIVSGFVYIYRITTNMRIIGNADVECNLLSIVHAVAYIIANTTRPLLYALTRKIQIHV